MRLIYSRKNYQDSSLKSQDIQFCVNWKNDSFLKFSKIKTEQKSSVGKCSFQWAFL